MSDDTQLDETIYTGQPAHDDLHSEANAQLNYLTGKVKTIREAINTGRLSAGGLSDSIAAAAGPGSSIDVRRLANASDATTVLRATEGVYMGLRGDPAGLQVTDGRLISTTGTTLYFDLAGSDTLQYDWALAYWPTNADGNLTLAVTKNNWHDGPGPNTAGVHNVFSPGIPGQGDGTGYVTAGGYYANPDVTQTNGNDTRSWRGKTVLHEVFVDKTTGRTVSCADGKVLSDTTQPAIAQSLSRYGFIELTGAIPPQLIAFGVSPDAHTPPSVVASSAAGYPVSDFTVTGTSTKIPNLAFVDVVYPPSGRVVIQADLYFTGASLTVRDGTETAADGGFCKVVGDSATHDGRVHFRAIRSGAAGTTERVRFWAQGSGVIGGPGTGPAVITATPV